MLKKILNFASSKLGIRLSFLLIISLFFISRFPFYQYFYFPRFHSDSYYYYYISYLISTDNSGMIEFLPLDVPLGYSLIASFFFNHSRSILIFLQSFFALISFLYLFKCISKYYVKYSLFALIMLSFYLFDNSLLKYEFGFYTESFFTSCIFIFMGLLIEYLKTNSVKYYISIFVLIFILVIIRSNGYVFILVPAVIFFIKRLFSKKEIVKVSTSYLILFLILSSFNYSYKNYFFPLEYLRIKSTLLNKNVTKNTNFSDKEYIKKHNSKIELLMGNIFLYSKEESNFYKSYLPNQSSKINEMKLTVRDDLKKEINNNIRKKILGDLNKLNNRTINIESNIFIKFISLLGKLNIFIIKSSIIYLLAIVFSLFSFFKLVLKKSNTEDIVVLLLFMIYSTNILFNVLSNVWLNSRYTSPFDICIILIVIIGITNFNKTKFENVSIL